MRHGKKIKHLGRTTPHRKSMMANMTSSLILEKRIKTTVPKAKALRKYAEPIINRSKDDTTPSRRLVFSHLQSKEAVKELFDQVAIRVADRPGGYTRIIKIGARSGDNAEMCYIELVDYNELMAAEPKAKRTRRSRRSKSNATATATTAVETEEACS